MRSLLPSPLRREKLRHKRCGSGRRRAGTASSSHTAKRVEASRDLLCRQTQATLSLKKAVTNTAAIASTHCISLEQSWDTAVHTDKGHQWGTTLMHAATGNSMKLLKKPKNRATQFSSGSSVLSTLCDPMDCEKPAQELCITNSGFARTPRPRWLLMPPQLSVYAVPSLNLNISQHRVFSDGVSSLHQVVRISFS